MLQFLHRFCTVLHPQEIPGLCYAEVVCPAGYEKTDDQAEETQDGAEDFDDEDLDETGGALLAYHV